MLIWLKQYLTGPEQCFSYRYRLPGFELTFQSCIVKNNMVRVYFFSVT